MTTSVASGAPRAASPGEQRVELATLAVSKALRVQRAQADAMVSLIEGAGGGSHPDVGRVISVRA